MATADAMERLIQSARKIPGVLTNRQTFTADAAERLINAAKNKSVAKPAIKSASKKAGKSKKPASTGSSASQPAPEAISDTTNYNVAPVTRSAESWTLESDPVYQQALAGGQSAFNIARANALANLQNQQTEANQATKEIGTTAADARERLAGNFAARGMAGGAYGALTRAEAEANARQVAAQTSIQDQIAAVNQQYLANFGATGTDWTGTLVGQDYRNQAIQQAMNSLLPRYTGV